MCSVEKTRGLLVAVEGVDAVGKKTQSLLLCTWLNSKNITSKMLSFPDYSTAIGSEIRGFLSGSRAYSAEVRHMLYAVNRWERKTDIDALLATFDVLVVNRYSASNLAYGIANGLKLNWLVNLEAGLPAADLVFILNAPPSMLSSRRGLSKDIYERNPDLQEKVHRVYLQLAEEFKWTVIDATQRIQNTHLMLVRMVARALTARGRSV
jgi:dTMP kinase